VSLLDPTTIPAELPSSCVASLVYQLNEVNSELLYPEATGTCYFELDGQPQCLETTQRVCEIGLRGTFAKGQDLPEMNVERLGS
jgi:hypothetical protein